MFFSACRQLCVSTPTSRWVISDFCDTCAYSTGSSTVMMWPAEVRLRWSTMAASEVDFPEPVLPTSSTSPRFSITTLLSTSGRRSFSKFGISAAMVRRTMPTCPCCMKTLTLKRETPGTAMAKLLSISWANSSRWRGFIMASARRAVTTPVSFCCARGVICPWALMLGG